ncbi:hypothetical protein EPR50_G00113960 [Perca flavescens]|uniref:BAR domain-containing protein n=1 Tax=Perca flavescens TaxID=8167 RepID=A0A484CUK7_PERFV|nr:hypothetical protein EPR50_G00113960 [Perca flavescens]
MLDSVVEAFPCCCLMQFFAGMQNVSQHRWFQPEGAERLRVSAGNGASQAGWSLQIDRGVCVRSAGEDVRLRDEEAAPQSQPGLHRPLTSLPRLFLQLLNERLMGAEGTKMDDDFLKMEKSVEVLQALLVELLSRTTEFLQPHPGARAKLSVLNTMSRIRGHGGGAGYPQTESMLGDCMSHYGRELGPASEFGGALTEAGGALQEVAQARDALGVDIKRTFIDPLEQLQNTELKEIRFQLKKLNGRRLDFDYKRRRRGKVPAEEVQWAWDKFLLSKELAERSMFVLLQSDVDQLSRLAALVAAQLDFHRNAHRILLGLHGNLQAR